MIKGNIQAMGINFIQIGRRITRLRVERNLTREQLAEIAGISSRYLYEIEYGKKKLSAEVLYYIASGLKVSCDYLLIGSQDEIEADH